MGNNQQSVILEKQNNNDNPNQPQDIKKLDMSPNHNLFVVGKNNYGQSCVNHNNDVFELINWNEYNEKI